MFTLQRCCTFAIVLSLALSSSARAEKAQERLQDAAIVFEEIMNTPEKGIPHDLLEKAHCVVIVPGVKKFALGVGGKYGRGFAMCRQQGHRGWGAPAAVRMEGGSIGWQIGGSESDVVLLVMNESGMRQLLESKFTFDANASVAAGPVGRTAQASTDAQLTAGILSYSRARGLFAGLSVGGATLRNDLDENRRIVRQAADQPRSHYGERKAARSGSPIAGRADEVLAFRGRARESA